MTEFDPRFIELEPPPGGLRRLQHQVAAAHSPRPGRRLQFAGALATAAVLVGCLWLPALMTQRRLDADLVQAVRRATARPTGGVQVIDGAAIELPSGQSNVRIYLVQTDAQAPHGGHD